MRELVDGRGQEVHVVDAEHDDGQQGEARVEQLNRPFGEVFLPTPSVVEIEPELTHRHEDVFVEHMADQVAHPLVVVSTVLQ